MRNVFLGLVGLVGCPTGEEKPAGGDDDDAQVTSAQVDRDNDGYSADEDCDDDAAEVHPGALEHCDGVDEDCDAVADDDPVDGVFGYSDADGDGFGVDPVDPCDPGEDYALAPGDCADDDPSVNPAMGERCNGVDDDCDPRSPDTAQIGDRGFGSIADALAAAIDGDVIEVCDGTFYEWGLTVQRDVTVTSHSGDRDAAVVNGDAAGSVFVVEGGGSLTLRSITVRNGSDPAAYGGGGAVRADVGAVVVEDCVITDNEVALGSGGAISGNDVTVTDSSFTENRAGTDGGAIWISTWGTVTVTGSTFEHNRAGASGGAIYARDLYAVTIEGSTFTGNDAELAGGAISADDLTLVDSTFDDNTADGGGGVSTSGTSSVVGCWFEGNHADMSGGGLSSGDYTSVADSSFVDNSALIGGGMYMSYSFTDDPSLDLVAVWFDRNYAVVNGGGLYLFRGSGTADAETLFTDNTVGDGYLGSGGGLFANIDPEDTWSGGTFRGNSSDEWGGGVIAFAGTLSGMTIEGNAARYGAGIDLKGEGIVVRDSVVSGNSGSQGAGVSAEAEPSTGAPIVLERVEIRGNTTTGSGAGVSVEEGEVQLVDCVVEENTAMAGGGGVALTGTDGSLVVESSDFGVDLTDNAPDDVWDGGESRQGYGAAATFSCVLGGGCTSP